jgi:hypothetical protein
MASITVRNLDDAVKRRLHKSAAAVAMRDIGDFEQCGVEIIDPWTS